MQTRHKIFHNSGFTIVELLIVIVVIAVLAAITVVAYSGIQERANSTAIISQAEAYIKGLKMWEVDEGRPAISSCIVPDSYTTCANVIHWNVNISVDSVFMQKLAKYSGAGQMSLGKWGPSNPVGLMWYHENYWGKNRSVLTYTVGPKSNCGLGNILSPTPGYENLVLAGASYTSRGADYTECMIEVFKW